MDKQCFIIGGGPSLKNFNWDLLDDKFTIAINNSYQVLPNANIIYFTDEPWWKEHKNGILKHSGRKIKGSLPGKQINHPNVEEFVLVGEKGFEESKSNQLYHGRNSTYAAINFAVTYLGFKQIYLLGIDMKYQNKKTHWHKGHSRIDPPTTYKGMIKNFNWLSNYAVKNKIKIINVNYHDYTDLTCFPIIPPEEIFDCSNVYN